MDIAIIVGAGIVSLLILRGSGKPPTGGVSTAPPALDPPFSGGAGQGGGNPGSVGTVHSGYSPPPRTNGSVYTYSGAPSTGPAHEERSGVGAF